MGGPVPPSGKEDPAVGGLLRDVTVTVEVPAQPAPVPTTAPPSPTPDPTGPLADTGIDALHALALSVLLLATGIRVVATRHLADARK